MLEAEVVVQMVSALCVFESLDFLLVSFLWAQ